MEVDIYELIVRLRQVWDCYLPKELAKRSPRDSLFFWWSGLSVYNFKTMQAIPHMHDFFVDLPQAVKDQIAVLSVARKIAGGQEVYRQNDPSLEVYRLHQGRIKLCNYSVDGDEIITGELRAGDCFGEMGLIDGLPRMSHAIASTDSIVHVLSAKHFNDLRDRHPEIDRQISIVLCRRVRALYSLNEDAAGLKLSVRIARVILRLAYSHGRQDESGATIIRVSHEEMSKMLGASRQSVSKELKSLEQAGDIELRYGKIYICDLPGLAVKYEDELGREQVTPVYQ